MDGGFWLNSARETRAIWIKQYCHVRNMRREFGPRDDYPFRLKEARRFALMNAAEAREMRQARLEVAK